MINQTMKLGQSAGSWTLSPSCLIDRLLDHIEKLSGAVAPAQVGEPSHTDVEPKARLEQFGA